MTKSPHQVYSEREAEFENRADDSEAHFCEGTFWFDEGDGLRFDQDKAIAHNRKTLHAVIDAMYDQLKSKAPDGTPVIEYVVGYVAFRDELLTYLREFKTKI